MKKIYNLRVIILGMIKTVLTESNGKSSIQHGNKISLLPIIVTVVFVELLSIIGWCCFCGCCSNFWPRFMKW